MSPAAGEEGAGAAEPWRRRSLVGPRFVLAGADAARLLAILVVVAVFVWLAIQVSVVTVPVLLAVLLTALHRPLYDVFRRAHLPAALAAGISMVVGLSVVGALGWFVYHQLATDLGDVADSFERAIERALNWLEDSPFGVGPLDVGELTSEVGTAVEENQSQVAAGALAAVTSVSHLLAGLAIAIFCWFFFLYDGERIWSWVSGLLPRQHRDAVDEAARHGWTTLVGFMRGLVIVAAFDAVLIGIGLILLDVPLALPLSVLVFLGAFVPVVGATVTGALAALVALTEGGLPLALLVIGLVLLVQQIEGNLLQPIVVGRMTSVHPVGIVLAVGAGALVAGVAGALFAVPLVAFLNAFADRLTELQRSSEG